MCTVTRRFILRLAVGLFAFLLGISAAWALGGFNPFQSSSGERHYRYQRDGFRHGLDAQPGSADMPRAYRKRDKCNVPSLSELPPPPPPAPHRDAPMPPNPPSSLR